MSEEDIGEAGDFLMRAADALQSAAEEETWEEARELIRPHSPTNTRSGCTSLKTPSKETPPRYPSQPSRNI